MIEAVLPLGLSPLAVGSQAPDFTLRDQNNEDVTLSSFRDDKAVLVIFYPFAFTGICTGELRKIATNVNDFVNEDSQVLSISCDSPYAQKTFALRDDLKFPLLSDFWPHGEVAQAFGVFNPEVGVSNRGTFVIDKAGVIRFSECNEMGQGRDAGRWLAELNKVTGRA